MERLILRALEKDPARRPQTAEQFRDELLAVPGQARSARAATPSRSSTPVPVPAPAAIPRRGERILWVAAAATAVLVLTGIAAAVWRPPSRAVAAASVAPTGRDPGLARALVAQSQERQQAGNLAAARDLLEAALAADPENAEAHYGLASLLWATDAPRARSEYEASRKLDPVRYGPSVARILDGLK